MDKNNFSEKDKEKFVEFLNIVAKKAKFEMDTNEIISYFSALSYMQQNLLPKIESNILEVKKVVEAPKEEKPEPKKSRSTRKKS